MSYQFYLLLLLLLFLVFSFVLFNGDILSSDKVHRQLRQPTRIRPKSVNTGPISASASSTSTTPTSFSPVTQAHLEPPPRHQHAAPPPLSIEYPSKNKKNKNKNKNEPPIFIYLFILIYCQTPRCSAGFIQRTSKKSGQRARIHEGGTKTPARHYRPERRRTRPGFNRPSHRPE